MKTTSGIEIDTNRIKEIIIGALELSEDDAKKFKACPYENRLYKGGCGNGGPVLDRWPALSKTGMASAMYANILKRYRMLEPHNYCLVDNFCFFNNHSKRFGDAFNAVIYKLNKEHKLIK
jgi:hypothetical protein